MFLWESSKNNKQKFRWCLILSIAVLLLMTGCTRTMKATPAGSPTANLTLWPTSTWTPSPTTTPYQTSTLSVFENLGTQIAAGTPIPVIASDRPPTATDAPCRLEFFSDVTVRDGKYFDPGEIFLKVWRFENVGDCTFTAQYYFLAYDGGDSLGGPPLAQVLFYPQRTEWKLKLGDEAFGQHVEIIEVGQMIEIPLFLRAPREPGRYRGYWKIVHSNDGSTIEDDFWVEIRVRELDEDSGNPEPDWSGIWLNSDPSMEEKLISPMNIYQRGDQVSGFLYGSGGRAFFFKGQTDEAGTNVNGVMGDPWDEGMPFQWRLLENHDQFQGVYWPGDGDGSEWCGGRHGQPLPEKCFP